MNDDQTSTPANRSPYRKTCSKCGEAEPGPGGILCGPCKTAIESAPLYPDPGGAA